MQETQETQGRSLSQEDPMKTETATHSSILAWKIPWTEEPGGLCIVHGVTKELDIIDGLSTAQNIQLYIHITSSLSIHLLMGT